MSPQCLIRFREELELQVQFKMDRDRLVPTPYYLRSGVNSLCGGSRHLKASEPCNATRYSSAGNSYIPCTTCPIQRTKHTQLRDPNGFAGSLEQGLLIDFGCVLKRGV